MNSVSLVFAASMTALTAVSLVTKAYMPPDHGLAGATQRAETRAVERLLEDGWISVDSMPLTADNLVSARVFVAPRCDGAVLVIGLPPTGEAGALVDRLAGPDGFVLYLAQDRLTTARPGAGAYVMAKLAPLIARFGDSAMMTGVEAPVAIVALGTCADSALLPWAVAAPPPQAPMQRSR